MSEVFTLYCSFMWLLTIGITCAALSDKDRELTATERTGAAINLIFAPLITSIVLGYLIYNS